MYDDGIGEIEFPTPICSDKTPHAKHRVAGTWREECRGVEGPAVEHNATDEHACTECGHRGNGQVPGCTCIGCDDNPVHLLEVGSRTWCGGYDVRATVKPEKATCSACLAASAAQGRG